MSEASPLEFLVVVVVANEAKAPEEDDAEGRPLKFLVVVADKGEEAKAPDDEDEEGKEFLKN